MDSPGRPGASSSGTHRGLRLFYGGTFDPVHRGHLAIARAAADTLACVVRMMPAADPPHRSAPGANAAQRAAMLELAVEGDPRLCVDRRELERGGRSYSVDTLRAIRAEVGADLPIALLVGADSFTGLPTWRDWRSLFELAHFVVAERPGTGFDRVPAELSAVISGRWADSATALGAAPAGRVLRLHQPLHLASASEVRRRIDAGDDWRSLVPPAVADYIVEHRLYMNGSPPAPRL